MPLDGPLVGIGVLVGILGAYFLPTLIALSRGHHQRLAIGILNLAGGWTVIGWIAAIVWACMLTQSQTDSLETRMKKLSPT